MKPDEPSSRQSGMPLLPQRSISIVPQPRPGQEAAVDVIRLQIDNMLSDKNVSSQPVDDNPYQKTHVDHSEPEADKWKQYHSAWQDYYQKYYEGYYSYHLKKAQQRPNGQYTNSDRLDDAVTADENIFDLRQKLIGKVKDSAVKVRRSRHFIPLIAGASVVLIFLFLQYNRVIFSNVVAYISPGDINPQNIIIDPNLSLAVSAEPRIIIPKINVDVPVTYDIGNDYTSQMAAMTTGLAHFAIPGANSHPGQIGNTVIAGHSSNDLLDIGKYKFIFAQLEKLQIGDTIYANYNSVRYTYTVTKKEVVQPNDVDKLIYPTTKPILTLLTCVPLGTANSRLLITAEQIIPDPALSVAAPTATSQETTSIPGNSPTFLERIFGTSN